MKTFGQKLPGVEYVERPGAYGFLLDETGRLALVRTSHGLFLPGGGVEAGEDFETALAREFMEEIGYRVTRAIFLGRAAQNHHSRFYARYFSKLGSFYKVEAERESAAAVAPGHTLEWTDVGKAAPALSQDFQRWAIKVLLEQNPPQKL